MFIKSSFIRGFLERRSLLIVVGSVLSICQCLRYRWEDEAKPKQDKGDVPSEPSIALGMVAHSFRATDRLCILLIAQCALRGRRPVDTVQEDSCLLRCWSLGRPRKRIRGAAKVK